MVSMMRKVQPSPRSMAEAQGAMAPSRIDLEGSGMISSGSGSTRLAETMAGGAHAQRGC
jgi:hypothetical protein